MAKKQNKITQISSFEETSMYMSYRYAIGRQSIASLMHANDIATNLFYRIPNDVKEFTSFDIAREIDSILRYRFNLYIDYPNQNKNFHPVSILMDFISKYNVKNLNDFNKFDNIHYDCLTDQFNVKYTLSSPDHNQYDIKRTFYLNDIENLLPWQKLSECFDVKNLKLIKTIYQNQENQYVCFKSYWPAFAKKIIKDLQNNDCEINDLENISWTQHWINIEQYLNGNENTYVADQYIVDVKPITDDYLKQFEKFRT